jgi:hypothetical protein
MSFWGYFILVKRLCSIFSESEKRHDAGKVENVFSFSISVDLVRIVPSYPFSSRSRINLVVVLSAFGRPRSSLLIDRMYNGGVGGINGKASASYNGEDGNGGDNLRKKSGRKSSRNRIMRSDENTPLTSSSRSKRKQPPGKTLKERFIAVASIAASIAALVLCAIVLFTAFFGGQFKGRTRKRHAGSALIGGSDTKQLYDDMGRFIMEDYDRKPPFSDFLPAVAGYYGKPLYAFFVNRGQGIASFGVESKDYPIMEFNSANKAYQVTPFVGFRTFLKGSRRGQQFLVEPFSPLNTRHVNEEGMPRRTMFIGSNEMQLQEVDPVTELETNVTYIILPEEDFGAFVRRTKITNTGRRSVNLSILDGLAKIEPAGGKMDELLKNVGRTLEGFMGVYSPYNDTLQMPFYRLSTQPADSAAVVVQEAGHWCLSVLEKEGGMSLLPIIYDPSKVFGFDTTMLRPVELQTRSVREIIDSPQYGFAKTASAFAAVDDITLEAGGSLTITSYFGKANHVLEVPVISRRLMQLGFSEYKVSRSREIIQQITSSVETETSSKLFNAHIGQMFLDNSLRGGIPSILGDVDDDSHMRNADEDGRLKTFHLFSRIHGDLERDYNSFKIIPTFFSEVCVTFFLLSLNSMSIHSLLFLSQFEGPWKFSRRLPESTQRCNVSAESGKLQRPILPFLPAGGWIQSTHRPGPKFYHYRSREV